MMTNCYTVLGVRNFATQEEIKTAYRKLSKKFHPDMNDDGDKFWEERFRDIQRAYDILMDADKRNIHDVKLKNQFAGAGTYQQSRQYKADTTPPKSATHRPPGTAASPKKKSASQPKKPKKQSALRKYFWAIIFWGSLAAIIVLQVRNQNINTELINETQTADTNTTVPTSVQDAAFTAGSTKDEVLRIQGQPTSVHQYESIGEEVWGYGNSTVTFHNGSVKEFSNDGGNLKVR